MYLLQTCGVTLRQVYVRRYTKVKIHHRLINGFSPFLKNMYVILSTLLFSNANIANNTIPKDTKFALRLILIMINNTYPTIKLLEIYEAGNLWCFLRI